MRHRRQPRLVPSPGTSEPPVPTRAPSEHRSFALDVHWNHEVVVIRDINAVSGFLNLYNEDREGARDAPSALGFLDDLGNRRYFVLTAEGIDGLLDALAELKEPEPVSLREFVDEGAHVGADGVTRPGAGPWAS